MEETLSRRKLWVQFQPLKNNNDIKNKNGNHLNRKSFIMSSLRNRRMTLKHGNIQTLGIASTQDLLPNCIEVTLLMWSQKVTRLIVHLVTWQHSTEALEIWRCWLNEVKYSRWKLNAELGVQEKYVHMALNVTTDSLSVIIMKISFSLKNKWKKCGLSDLISLLF